MLKLDEQIQNDMKLPTRNGMCCLVDLLLESGNILNVLELIQYLISALQALEKHWKKAKNQGTSDETKAQSIIYSNHVQA